MGPGESSASLSKPLMNRSWVQLAMVRVRTLAALLEGMRVLDDRVPGEPSDPSESIKADPLLVDAILGVLLAALNDEIGNALGDEFRALGFVGLPLLLNGTKLIFGEFV